MQVEWERCLNYLHGMLSDTVFKTYFAQTKLVSQTPGHAVIAVPPGLDVKVYAAYKDLIRLAWKDVSHDEAPVEFEFQPQDVYQPQASASENSFREFILRFGGKPVSTNRWFRCSIRWINNVLKWVYRD